MVHFVLGTLERIEFCIDKKDLQPKPKAPVVRPTTITPPQLSEEQLTGGISGGQGLHASGCACHSTDLCTCSFGDDSD